MGIFRDIAGAAIGGAGGAAAASGGKKRANNINTDDPGAPGQDVPGSSSDAGTDGGFGSYIKRTGKTVARRALQKRDM